MSRIETAGAGAPGRREPRKRKPATQALGATKSALKGRAGTSSKRASGQTRTPLRAPEPFPEDTSAAVGPMGTISPEQWRAMVAEAAYFRAQRRGFGGGSPEQDWYEAEEEIRRSLEER
ncbi:MAG TPA: DUF2934 domain-containing protein [Burkholderiales bacterium]|nr:DUF2934 domain-containing protein [Burkholderiales bacterium]